MHDAANGHAAPYVNAEDYQHPMTAEEVSALNCPGLQLSIPGCHTHAANVTQALTDPVRESSKFPVKPPVDILARCPLLLISRSD